MRTVDIHDNSPFWKELREWVDSVNAVRTGPSKPRALPGIVGEFVVYASLLSTKRKPVPLDASSWYDQEKDGYLEDGTTYEVKTGRPWHQERAFATDPNQVPKLTEVDEVYYVEQPYEFSPLINIWSMPKESRVFHEKVNPYGKTRALLPFTSMVKYDIFKSRRLASVLRGDYGI